MQACNLADVIPDTLSDEMIAAYVESAASEERMREVASYYHLENILSQRDS
jgi:hypothetical protein